jgi:hypothetical protein
LSSCGEAAPHSGDDESWRREVVALAENKMRSEITRRPRLEKGRSLGAELVHQVAQSFAFDGVQEAVGHS